MSSTNPGHRVVACTLPPTFRDFNPGCILYISLFHRALLLCAFLFVSQLSPKIRAHKQKYKSKLLVVTTMHRVVGKSHSH